MYASVFPRIHQLVRISFPRIRQLVRISFSENPSACTHKFFRESVQLVHISFSLCIHQLVHMRSPSETFSKYTPPFLINGSCLSPNLKKDSFARCVSTPFSHKQLTLRIGFRHVPPHGKHTVSSDRKFSTRSVSFRIPGAVFRLLP